MSSCGMWSLPITRKLLPANNNICSRGGANNRDLFVYFVTSQLINNLQERVAESGRAILTCVAINLALYPTTGDD